MTLRLRTSNDKQVPGLAIACLGLSSLLVDACAHSGIVSDPFVVCAIRLVAFRPDVDVWSEPNDRYRTFVFAQGDEDIVLPPPLTTTAPAPAPRVSLLDSALKVRCNGRQCTVRLSPLSVVLRVDEDSDPFVSATLDCWVDDDEFDRDAVLAPRSVLEW